MLKIYTLLLVRKLRSNLKERERHDEIETVGTSSDLFDLNSKYCSSTNEHHSSDQAIPLQVINLEWSEARGVETKDIAEDTVSVELY